MSTTLRVADRTASLQSLARLLDAVFRIPGTEVRFGLDAMIGIIPGVGDLAGAVVAGYLVIAAARLGASPAVLLRMLLNVAVDTLLGSIPFLGDVFDVAWRANTRNVALLQRHLARPAATRAASRAVVAGVLFGIVLLLVGGLAVTWLALEAIARRAS